GRPRLRPLKAVQGDVRLPVCGGIGRTHAGRVFGMKISIGRGLVDALVALRDNGRTLLLALAPPAIGIALLTVWAEQQPPGTALRLLLMLPLLFLYALFAVTCHRVILLGRKR